VDQCKSLAHGVLPLAKGWGAAAATLHGRGLHSFPFPLNLSSLRPFPLNFS